MAARPTTPSAGPVSVPPPRTPAAADRERDSSAPPEPWVTHRQMWMLAALRLPTGVVHGYGLDPTTRQPTTTRLSAPDGSWCEIALAPPAAGTGPGPRPVREAGPTPLWSHVEDAFTTWHTHGRPGWDRFGLTITAQTSTLWLDTPDNPIGHHTATAGWHRPHDSPIPVTTDSLAH